MLEQFLWIIYPYLALTIFIIGHIFRYQYDQFNWTAKSSEFIEQKSLKWGSILFHLGIVPVFFGHVMGLLIPPSWMDFVGLNNHLYHILAVYVGGFFGIMTLLGMVMLTFRRLTKKNVFRLSSASDILVNVMLLIIIIMGLYSTLITNAVVTDFDYRETISVWFRELLIFRPDASDMTNVPLSFKIHILLGLSILAIWPFTRLVHVWSLPFNYGTRSYILYRQHKK